MLLSLHKAPSSGATSGAVTACAATVGGSTRGGARDPPFPSSCRGSAGGKKIKGKKRGGEIKETKEGGEIKEKKKKAKKVDLREGPGGKSLPRGVPRRRGYFPPEQGCGRRALGKDPEGFLAPQQQRSASPEPKAGPSFPRTAPRSRSWLQEPLLHILIIGIISREFRKQQ